MNRVIILLVCCFLCACIPNKYDPKDYLSQSGYDSLLLDLAPYVNKKPKKATFPERFDPRYRPYYEAAVKGQQSNIPLFYKTDSLHYFFYVNKDLTSLYEHYKGYGGTFTKDSTGKITGLNMVFTTPRFTKEEAAEKGIELFSEMVKTGDVSTFKGNREYVHLPNADFEYNRQENKWVYTVNSSWNFLKELKEAE